MRNDLGDEHFEYAEQRNGSYTRSFGGFPTGVRRRLEDAPIHDETGNRRFYIPESIDDAVRFLNDSLLVHIEQQRAKPVRRKFIGDYRQRKKYYDANKMQLAILLRQTIEAHLTEDIIIKKLSQ